MNKVILLKNIETFRESQGYRGDEDNGYGCFQNAILPPPPHEENIEQSNEESIEEIPTRYLTEEERDEIWNEFIRNITVGLNHFKFCEIKHATFLWDHVLG